MAMPVDSYRIALRSRVLAPAPWLAAVSFGLVLSAFAPPLQAQEPEATAPATLSATPSTTPPADLPVTSGCGGSGQVGQGFLAYTGLGGRLASLPMPTTTATATMPATATDSGAGPQWSLLVGYKLCRVVVGLNFDLLIYSPTGSSKTLTSFSVAPEVQVALARSRDYRAELIGALNVGLGQLQGAFQISGMVAPGLRYWVHRHIALTTLLGLGTGVTLQGKGATVLLNLQGSAGVLGAF
jgi:hypothetical protein